MYGTSPGSLWPACLRNDQSTPSSITRSHLTKMNTILGHACCIRRAGNPAGVLPQLLGAAHGAGPAQLPAASGDDGHDCAKDGLLSDRWPHRGGPQGRVGALPPHGHGNHRQGASSFMTPACENFIAAWSRRPSTRSRSLPSAALEPIFRSTTAETIEHVTLCCSCCHIMCLLSMGLPVLLALHPQDIISCILLMRTVACALFACQKPCVFPLAQTCSVKGFTVACGCQPCS